MPGILRRGAYLTSENKGGSRWSPESLDAGRKTTWRRSARLLWPWIVFSSAIPLSLPPSLFSLVSPFLSVPLQTFLPDSFVCQDPGYHGYQLALYEHLIPHLNIPSYLW